MVGVGVVSTFKTGVCSGQPTFSHTQNVCVQNCGRKRLLGMKKSILSLDPAGGSAFIPHYPPPTNFWIRSGLRRRQIPDGEAKLSDGDCF